MGMVASPQGDADVTMRFKVAASRRIQPIRGRAFWQARFYDRVLRNRAEYDEAFDCIHMNPVRRRLVEDPLQWQWSSGLWFAERAGSLAMDRSDYR